LKGTSPFHGKVAGRAEYASLEHDLLAEFGESSNSLLMKKSRVSKHEEEREQRHVQEVELQVNELNRQLQALGAEYDQLAHRIREVSLLVIG
jgi:preprotein translocase subunit SecA